MRIDVAKKYLDCNQRYRKFLCSSFWDCVIIRDCLPIIVIKIVFDMYGTSSRIQTDSIKNETGHTCFLFVFSPNDTKLCLGDRIFGEKKVFFKRFYYFWKESESFFRYFRVSIFWFLDGGFDEHNSLMTDFERLLR